MAWLGTYAYRTKFTINHALIDSDQTFIPITVFLSATQGGGGKVFTEFDADEDFDRCAFTKADGDTQLKADCEQFDDSASKAIYHVSLTGWSISSSVDTVFYYYYDNSAGHNTTYISKSGGTAAQSVYDANFKAVYHMHDFNNWTTQYEGDVEPDSDGWTLGGTDYSSVSAGILTIDTSADDGYTCYYYKTPDVDFNAGFYLKTRVKASTDMDDQSDGLHIQIKDGTQNEQFWMRIADGKVYYFYESNNWSSVVLDTTTAYVTYEIYIKGTAFIIYADGVQKVSNNVDNETVTDLVQFGDNSPDAGNMCKAEIDYIYYALSVADNPLLTIYDSTSNNNDGTKKGLLEPVEATGKVGQAQDFDGTNDYIQTATLLDVVPAALTLEMVVYHTETSGKYMMTKDNITNEERFYWLYASTTYESRIDFEANNGGYTTVTSDTGLTKDAYEHTVITWDTVNGIIFYLAGAADGGDGSKTTLPLDGVAQDFTIGAMSNNLTSAPFDGVIDEVRVHSAARAAAWVKATYNSLWDTLLTYSGEERQQSTTGSLNFAGTVTRSNVFSRALSGALNFVGDLATQHIPAIIQKALTGSLNFAGAVSKFRTLKRTLTGVLNFGAVVAEVIKVSIEGVLNFAGTATRTRLQSLTGALSFVGSLTNKIAINLAGAVSFAGDITKLITRSLSGALYFTGSIGKSIINVISLTGSLVLTGSIAKATKITIEGALNFAGDISKSIIKSLAGAIYFTGSAIRARLVSLSGAINFTGSIVKAISTSLSGSIYFTGSVVKKLFQSFTGSLNFAGAMTKIPGKLLTGALNFSGTVTKLIAKALAGALYFTGSVVATTAALTLKTITGALNFSGAITKKAAINLSGVLDFSGAVSTISAVIKNLLGSLVLTGTVAKKAIISLSGALNLSGNVTKLLNRIFTGALNFSGSIQKRIALSVSGSLDFSGSIARSIIKSLSGALNFIGTVTKGRFKALTGKLNFAGVMVKLPNKVLTGSIVFSGTVGKLVSKLLQGALDLAGTISHWLWQLFTKGIISIEVNNSVISIETNYSVLSVADNYSVLSLDENKSVISIENAESVIEIDGGA